MLEKLLSHPEKILIHFDPNRHFYVDIDASQEVGFGAHAEHMKDKGSEPHRKSQWPKLFLSKILKILYAGRDKVLANRIEGNWLGLGFQETTYVILSKPVWMRQTSTQIIKQSST